MIPYDERKAVYLKAIETYGARAQMIMVLEEMSELAQEICKCFRVPREQEPSRDMLDNLADECADVTIMLEQLRLIFDMNGEVCEHMDAKIQRLADRLGSYER